MALSCGTCGTKRSSCYASARSAPMALLLAVRLRQCAHFVAMRRCRLDLLCPWDSNSGALCGEEAPLVLLLAMLFFFAYGVAVRRLQCVRKRDTHTQNDFKKYVLDYLIFIAKFSIFCLFQTPLLATSVAQLLLLSLKRLFCVILVPSEHI